MSTVAFLGTGTMGMPMARHLADAGLPVRAWNRNLARAQPLAEQDGVQVLEDPADAASGADVLITMLSDAVAVLDSAPAALEALGEGGLWIQMSTIGLEGTERCAQLAGRARVTFVDAPVLGTRQPAEKGQLVVLASGPEDVRERCEPVFGAVGARTLWLGDAGAGTRCKVVVNSWIVGLVGVLAETISLAGALDIDPQHFFDAIDAGPLDLPYARMKGSAMIARAFDDASFRLALARKDADLVLSAASSIGLELPIMDAVARGMARAEQEGHGDEDMAAIYWVSAPEHVPAR